MKNDFQKLAGISILLGSVLLLVTMVLHPAGGSIEQILRIKTLIISTHSLAIGTMPILLFGFWGLAKSLDSKNQFSVLGFCFMIFSLFAGMMAAAINGLLLPLFISEEFVANADPKLIKAILTYGKNFNAAMDYILISGIGIAILVWSVCIIQTGRFKNWIAYLGFLLCLIGLLSSFSTFNFINLFGFRIVVAGICTWFIAIGFSMISSKSIHLAN